MVVAVLILAAGCAEQLYWKKAGATEADFQRDSYECKKDAYATGGAVYVGYGVTQRTPNSGMYSQCMVAHGYHLGPAPLPVVTSGPVTLVYCQLPNLTDEVTTNESACLSSGGRVTRRN